MSDRRCNVFVGRLNPKVTKTDMENLFKPFGKIIHIHLAAQDVTKSSCVYGFVHFTCEDDATAAIDKLNGIFFHGYRLRVEFGAQRDSRGSSSSQPPETRRSDQARNRQYHERQQQRQPNEFYDRGENLHRLKRIYVDVGLNPLLPTGAHLPELSQLLSDIDRLPYMPGPVFDRKKPKCFLDLDLLDDLSEKV